MRQLGDNLFSQAHQVVERFTEILMDHFQDPRNRGTVPNASCMGTGDLQGRPPFVTVHLAIENDMVIAAGFEAQGCGVTIACGSVLTEIVERKTTRQCEALTAEHLAEALGGVPPDKMYCAEVVVRALHSALNHWRLAS